MTASERIVVDIDDFEDMHATWAIPLLHQLHREAHGRFKATLFTIPARTSAATLQQAAGLPFLELGVHGWRHNPRECMNWDETRTREVLARCLVAGKQHEEDDPYYTAIFKAPYWQASDACYEALAKAGWGIADHPNNVFKIPRGCRSYILSPEHKIGQPHTLRPIIQAHGHFTNEVGNGLRENFAAFQALAQWGLPYAFVSEVLI